MLNSEYMATRLDDPTLLDRAVDVGDAAVPVGGKRRGGFVCMCDREHGEEVIAVLSEYDGFPNLRLVIADDPEVADNVRWGDEEPSSPSDEATDLQWACFDILNGRYYGYSEAAIRRFVVGHWGRRTAKAAFRERPIAE